MSKSVDEKRIRELIEEEVEKKISKYKMKEPLTREEFLKALELIEERFAAIDKRFEAMDKRFENLFEGQLLLKASIDSFGQRSGVRLEKTILKLLQYLKNGI
jgi:hypothetical protein